MDGQKNSERTVALLGMVRATRANESARSRITNSMHWLIREPDPYFITG